MQTFLLTSARASASFQLSQVGLLYGIQASPREEEIVNGTYHSSLLTSWAIQRFADRLLSASVAFLATPTNPSQKLACFTDEFAAGQATTTVSQQLKEAKVPDHLAVAGEKGKEYGAKGWGFLKSAYASVASGVETVARDNGYKVDLGEPCWQLTR